MHPVWQHPAVWLGDELFTRKDWLWELSAEELDELDQLIPNAAELSHPVDQLAPSTARTPKLTAKLTAIQDALETGSGAVLLRGFPLDRFDLPVVAALFWRLMHRVGCRVPQTADGQRLFHDALQLPTRTAPRPTADALSTLL